VSITLSFLSLFLIYSLIYSIVSSANFLVSSDLTKM
jgi:hypothetical protein